jgi:Berberine and berberine like
VIGADATGRARRRPRLAGARVGAGASLGIRGVYPNFPDPDLTDWAPAYYGTNYDRLRRVKAAYDPRGFFHFHQSLP